MLATSLIYLPVETMIRERQAEYYQMLAASDKQGNSTPFIEFLLSVLLQVLREATTYQVWKCMSKGLFH